MLAADPAREPGRGWERVVVVSDVHLSAGAGAVLFDADEAFARFLDFVGAQDGPAVDALVLAGDFFDLLQATTGDRPWRDTSETAALAKLELVTRARRVVARAVAGLAASGVRIAFIPGNHDLELVRPSAQRRARELLGGAAPGAEDAIEFHPWIVHRPDFLYAEHGSQHHDLNAIARLLAPSVTQLEVPLGAHLDLYRLDVAAGGGVSAHGRLASAVASRLLAAGDLRARRSRRLYRAEELPRHADEVGLSRETLAALDALSPVAPLAVARRALRELAVEPLLRRLDPAGVERRPYLEQAASAIDGVLARGGAAVPFYVFGHTHVPADRPLSPGNDAPRYLNPGTWSTVLPRQVRPLGDRARFGFLELERRPDAQPTARLLRWNDGARRAEPV